MIRIKIFPTISSTLQSEIDAFRQHNPGFSGRQRTPAEQKIHDDKYCSQKDIQRCILAFDDQLLVGQILVYLRQIKFAGEPISLGGIGAVRVAVVYRRQGIAARMMDVAMAELRHLNCDVAFLSTNIDSFLADFYKKYGFQVYKNTVIFRGKSGQLYQKDNGMLAPINSSQILDKVLNLKESLDLGIGSW